MFQKIKIAIIQNKAKFYSLAIFVGNIVGLRVHSGIKNQNQKTFKNFINN